MKEIERILYKRNKTGQNFKMSRFTDSNCCPVIPYTYVKTSRIMQFSRDYLHKSLSHFESQWADETQILINASACITCNDILYTYLRNCPSYIIFIETFPHTTLANSFLNSANPLFNNFSFNNHKLSNFSKTSSSKIQQREKRKSQKHESWKLETLEKNHKKFKKNNQTSRKLLKSNSKKVSKNSKRKDLEESRSRIIASQRERERERSGKPQKKEKKRKRMTKNLERT